MAATTEPDFEQIDDELVDVLLKKVYNANTDFKQMISIGGILNVMISDHDLKLIQENIDKLMEAGLIDALTMTLTEWETNAIESQLRMVLILLEVYDHNSKMRTIVESPLLEALAPHISTQPLAVKIVYHLCAEWSGVLCYTSGVMDNLRARIESTPNDNTAKDALDVLESVAGRKTKRAIA